MATKHRERRFANDPSVCVFCGSSGRLRQYESSVWAKRGPGTDVLIADSAVWPDPICDGCVDAIRSEGQVWAGRYVTGYDHDGQPFNPEVYVWVIDDGSALPDGNCVDADNWDAPCAVIWDQPYESLDDDDLVVESGGMPSVVTVPVTVTVTVDPYQWGADTGSELEYVSDVVADVRQYVADAVSAALADAHPHASSAV